MVDTDSGKTAEERIPFNYFKKIPKIVSILVGRFLTHIYQRSKDIFLKGPAVSANFNPLIDSF